MKKFIFNYLISLFQKEINYQANILFDKKWKEYIHDKDTCNLKCHEMRVGTPVICVGNQHSDLIVGFVTKIELITKANNPILIVHDYVTNKEIMCFGAVYDFTSQRLEALSMLNPAQRWSLVMKEGFYAHRPEFKELDPEWKNKLMQSEFYSDLKKFYSNLK